MEVLRNISENISKYLVIKSEYIFLIINSLVIIAIVQLIRYVIIKLSFKKDLNSKEKYMYFKGGAVASRLIIIILLTFVWMDYLKNFLTLITFISTAITLSIKEIIFNYFAGIYIRTSKVFSLEDRIEVDGIKGDVVNINRTGFDILELGERVNGEQSTGRIVHVPNAIVFTHPVKNYVKAFKYVWDELKITVPVDADITKTKKELYKIINKNSVVKHIPDKMKEEVNESSAEYRIYFNNLDPIIYVELVDGQVDMYMRFLVHPKKQRNIENSIWLDILKANNDGIIQLSKK